MIIPDSILFYPHLKGDLTTHSHRSFGYVGLSWDDKSQSVNNHHQVEFIKHTFMIYDIKGMENNKKKKKSETLSTDISTWPTTASHDSHVITWQNFGCPRINWLYYWLLLNALVTLLFWFKICRAIKFCYFFLHF